MVNNYEIVSAYNNGKKAETIAIGIGAVAGSTILGMGVWHGTKAYKNNQLREFEDSAYNKADYAYGAYEKAKNYREWAKNRENEAKKDSDKMWKQYVHDSDYNTRSANKAGYGWAEENYKDAKRDADKAYYQQEDARNKAIDNADYYDKVAKERAEKAQGLWRRKSDNERDNRYNEFMKKRI